MTTKDHSLATTIHRGAYVQSTAPTGAAIVAGILWVDTSSGPPYQLNARNTANTGWENVGIVSDTNTTTIRAATDYDDTTAPATGQAIIWNGTTYAPANVAQAETFGVVFTNAGNVALRGDGAIVTKRY